ncbi:hypothetical protein HAALTHF_18600n [Vreelandella aquamarina]|nr:hypothetical protein HAALTHF_18600n [Halomonas axialensis]
MLLVDEAAAIPASLLARWLAAFPRIAFATTVHGYEGSGRGFALRFRDILDRQAPQWRELTLQAPIRWSAGDPLEAVIQHLLLLDAPLPKGEPHQGERLPSMVISQAQLAERGLCWKSCLACWCSPTTAPRRVIYANCWMAPARRCAWC